MTVEDFWVQLEKITSSLTISGFNNIGIGTVEQLQEIADAAGELGMKEGKRLIENLSDAMKAIQEGKSGASSGNLRLTALEFYAKKNSQCGAVEDL